MLDAQEVTGSSPVSPTFSVYIELKRIAIINYKAYRESIYTLLEDGYRVILVGAFYGSRGSVASHADLQVFSLYKKVVVAPNISKLTLRQLIFFLKGEKEIIFGDKFLKEGYPNEVSYNAISLDKYLIGNLKYLDPTLLEIGKEYGFSFIHVNQGYVRCTSIPIGKNGVITEDIGIFKKLYNLGVKVKFFNPGYVDIDDYEYGFLAGASGIDNNIFYINGDVSLYPYKEDLIEYLRGYNIKIKNLALGKRIRDIGSILFI